MLSGSLVSTCRPFERIVQIREFQHDSLAFSMILECDRQEFACSSSFTASTFILHVPLSASRRRERRDDNDRVQKVQRSGTLFPTRWPIAGKPITWPVCVALLVGLPASRAVAKIQIDKCTPGESLFFHRMRVSFSLIGRTDSALSTTLRPSTC